MNSMYEPQTDDTKQVITVRNPETGKREWVEVFPEDEGYERSYTIYRTPMGWVTIPE